MAEEHQQAQDRARLTAPALAAAAGEAVPLPPSLPQPAASLGPPPARSTPAPASRPKIKKTFKRVPVNRAKRKVRRVNDISTEWRQADENDETFSGPVPCRVTGCDKLFENVADLDLHVQVAHGASRPHIPGYADSELQQLQPPLLQGPLQVPDQPLDSPPAVEVFKCEECGKTYGSSADLKRHSDRNHVKAQSSNQCCPFPDCAFPVQGNAELVLNISSVHAFSPDSRQASQRGQYPGSYLQPPPQPGLGHQAPSSNGLGPSLSSSMAGMSLGGIPVSSRNSFNPNLSQQAYVLGNPPPYHPFDYSYGYPSPWNRELKSGQDRSCAPKAKVHILWPH